MDNNSNHRDGCHSFFPQIGPIPVPNDVDELRYIPHLIDRVPEYIKKMDELERKITSLSETICKKEPLFDYNGIKGILYKAFFVEMENRRFNKKSIKQLEREKLFDSDYADARRGEIISNRNVACEICGENRSTDQCHIIPRKLGGTLNADNVLILCPTHHRLLDRFMLSKTEYASINWILKSKPSQFYAKEVTLENHKKFWNRIDEGNFSKIPPYEEWRDEWKIYDYTLKEIVNCFSNKDMVAKKSIMDILDENIKIIAKQLIQYLLKQNIMMKDKRGKFYPNMIWITIVLRKSAGVNLPFNSNVCCVDI